MIPLRNNPLTNEQIQTAFRAVLTIFAKWQCTTEEAQTLLGIKRSTWFKYKSAPETASFSHDLVERISYILNIHAALRILFSNPDSVYQWVRKPNKAPFYNGRSAMEIMLQGRVVDLWAVASRLNAERGGRA
ncbi:MAG TPA: MbcA/ParS/Xre antitoxin family protein [Legionella sp.]|nr:MbcA/ParS/Xre antitoxin family protein [Legionella sp.]